MLKYNQSKVIKMTLFNPVAFSKTLSESMQTNNPGIYIYFFHYRL